MAVFRTQQGTQGEPNVKTLRSPLSTEFWRHRVAELNAAHCLDTRAKKWKYKFKSIFHLIEWESNPQPVGFDFVPLRHDWPPVNV